MMHKHNRYWKVVAEESADVVMKRQIMTLLIAEAEGAVVINQILRELDCPDLYDVLVEYVFERLDKIKDLYPERMKNVRRGIQAINDQHTAKQIAGK